MILDKALLLKCLGGLTACSGVVGVGVVGHKEGWWSFSKNSTESAETLITNSGLSCTFGNSNNTNEGECTSVATDKKINVKYEDGTTKGEEKTFTVSGSTKIKVQKNTTEGSYNQNLKLTIEGGDITLTGGSGSITKLEQFETYEIVKEGDKYYLSRKEKATEEIRRNLGLPQSCTFPETNNSPSNPTCTIPQDDINSINFLGKSGTVTNTSSSTLSLTITKTSASEEYPYGLNFSFKSSSGDVTITTNSTPSITIKSTEASEFKIKKDGNDVKLEKTSTLSTITSKVGITCSSSDNTCSLNTTGKINIKKDQNKSEIDAVASSTGSSGKIKVYSGESATGYENGFKFAIEDGDITVGSGSSTKLEQFETYEIKKDADKWYLSRKTDALEGKSKALGLPIEDNACKLPTNGSTTCQLDEAKLKKINFDGKDSDGASIATNGTVTLTITKVDNSDSIFATGGYKFAFQSNKDITISSTSQKYIKKNTNTEFKIKETTSSGSAKTLSLEKAWTADSLAKKAQITSCTTTGSNKECTLGEKVNVIFDNSGSEYSLESDKQGKKLKYEEDQEGYNQGFKFYLDESEDLSLTNSTGGSADTSGDKKICKKSGNNNVEVYYEIKEEGRKWYLAKKTTGGAAS